MKKIIYIALLTAFACLAQAQTTRLFVEGSAKIDGKIDVLTPSYNNTIIGRSAGASLTSGTYNTATGYAALYSNTFGHHNAAFGHNALSANTYGNNNTAIGGFSLVQSKSGDYNTAVGYYSLAANETGQYNTALGYQSLAFNKVGRTTALGAAALQMNTYGSSNTAVGYFALQMNTEGSYNTAIGYETLSANSLASYNTALGYHALRANETGSDNTAVGSNALTNNTSGSMNTSVGSGALYGGTGGRNTAVGAGALAFTDATNDNTGIGSDCLSLNESEGNTAVGSQAMHDNRTGGNNVAIGFQSLYNNYDAYANVAIGADALHDNDAGSGNVGVGRWAHEYNKWGNYNTAIGYNAGCSANQNPSNFSAIGNNAGHVGGNSNTIEIGNTSVGWIGGQTGWFTYSDGRIKRNVKENVPGLGFITKLRPVTYNIDLHHENKLVYGMADSLQWEGKYDIEHRAMTGFIAQEVEAAAKACAYDFSGLRRPEGNGKLYSIGYAEFVVPLVKAVQEQQAVISEQGQEIMDLKARLEKLELLLSQPGQTQTVTVEGGNLARLEQNVPNPFKGSTRIAYYLPEGSSAASIRLTNANGQLLRNFPLSGIGAGQLEVSVKDLPKGAYFYTLYIGSQFVDSKKMLLQ
jgi:hypothetical protein